MDALSLPSFLFMTAKDKIAPVHPDLMCSNAAVPDGIRWLVPLRLSRPSQTVAAPLSQRCHGLSENYLNWFRALDSRHGDSWQAVLAMALRKFPHLTLT
jgi:hypothetical protein